MIKIDELLQTATGRLKIADKEICMETVCPAIAPHDTAGLGRVGDCT